MPYEYIGQPTGIDKSKIHYLNVSRIDPGEQLKVRLKINNILTELVYDNTADFRKNWKLVKSQIRAGAKEDKTVFDDVK